MYPNVYPNANVPAYGNFYAGRIRPRQGNQMLDYYPGIIIDPVLGVRAVNRAAVGNPVLSTPEVLDFENKDFVKRELGISQQIVRNNRILKGLANPGDYLEEKNTDIDRIGDECANEYRNVFTKYVNYGLTVEEAKRKAIKAADFRKQYLMKEHEILFPSDLTSEVMNKLKRRNEQRDF